MMAGPGMVVCRGQRLARSMTGQEVTWAVAVSRTWFSRLGVGVDRPGLGGHLVLAAGGLIGVVSGGGDGDGPAHDLDVGAGDGAVVEAGVFGVELRAEGVDVGLLEVAGRGG